VKNKQYHELRLAVQQYGAQQKAQKARAAAGLEPMTFTPLLPYMQRQLDSIKRSNSIFNPINNPLNSPINNPLSSMKRKADNSAKNRQTVYDNPHLGSTEKMSDGKHASICTCRTIPIMQIAVQVYGLSKLDLCYTAPHLTQCVGVASRTDRRDDCRFV